MQIANVEVVPLDCPLNDEQYKIIKNPYRESVPERAFCYATENPGIPKKVLQIDTDAMSLSEVALGYTSALGTSWAVMQLSNKTQKTRMGHIFLCAKAAAAAFVVFESVSVYSNLQTIQASAGYQKWKQTHIRIVEDESANFFFTKDDILRHLLCPISGKIPSIPVTLDYFEGAYDYTAAKEWIEKKPEIPLPGSRVVVTKEALKFDFAHINSIIKRLDWVNQFMCGKIEKKIMKVLCVKITSDNQSLKNIQDLFMIVELIAHNRIAQVADLFSGCFAHNDQSLRYLKKLEYLCFNKWISLFSRQQEEYQRADIVRLLMAKKTPQERKLYKKAKNMLENNMKLVKLVKCIIDPYIIKLGKYYLGIAPKLILSREIILGDEDKIENIFNK